MLIVLVTLRITVGLMKDVQYKSADSSKIIERQGKLWWDNESSTK